MSDAAQPDPGRAAGQALGVTLSWLFGWLNTQSALVVVLILQMIFAAIALHWAVTVVVPGHIQMINEGRKMEAEINLKNFQEQRTHDKESRELDRAHDRELVEKIERAHENDRKPIAVLPQAGSE